MTDIEYAAGDTHSFSFSTTDVSMTALMHALEGQPVRWFVTPEGIEISEYACNDQVSFYVNLPAKNFGKSFKCSGPVCIAFDPKLMYLHLKSHQQRDVCTWSFDPKRPHELKITIDSQGMGSLVQENHMWLQRVDTDRDDAEPVDVQYLLAFDTSEIPAVIHAFAYIDKFTRKVRITTTPKRITFSHVTPMASSHISYETMNEGGKLQKISRPEPKEYAPDPKFDSVRGSSDAKEQLSRASKLQTAGGKGTVAHTYDLWNLQKILKCFSISRGAVIVFVRKDNPLVFEIRVGTLGKMRIAVMFVPDGDEAEMFATD